MKEMKSWERHACYPIIVEMYEFKNKTSGDKQPTDIWIWTKEEIDLQIKLAFKKQWKREYHEYKTLQQSL
jgi:hypothetical protein